MLKHKWIAAAVIGTALLTSGVTAIGAQNTVSYPLCNVENCNNSQIHTHDGTNYYCGHFLGDGHTYHSVCYLNECNNTGVHVHDNCTYFGHCATNTTVSAPTGCHRGGHHGGHHGCH